MIQDPMRTKIFRHTFLILGGLFIIFPIYMAFVASTLRLEQIFQRPMPFLPGSEFFTNYFQALFVGGRGLGGAQAIGALILVQNSLILAVGITVSKIIISLLSSFAMVFFKFPGRPLAFWLVLFTLMLPVEVRIVPTYRLISDFGMLNSYVGLILPLSVSATATFLFRQYFLTIPDEMVEAAKVDGATPMRFFRSILVPMARTPIATLVVIQFVYGWNQYLWPLIITTERRYYTLMIGLSRMLATADHQADWHIVMSITIIAMIPTMIIVLSMQQQFVKGLTESDK